MCVPVHTVLYFAGLPICSAGSMWMKIGEVPTSPGYVLFICLRLTAHRL